MRKADAPKTPMDLIAEVEQKNGEASIIATSMQEADIRAWLSRPFTVIGSDGAGVGRHPRGYGAFPRCCDNTFAKRSCLPLSRQFTR